MPREDVTIEGHRVVGADLTGRVAATGRLAGETETADGGGIAAEHEPNRDRTVPRARPSGPVLLATDCEDEAPALCAAAEAVGRRLGGRVEVVSVLEPGVRYAPVSLGMEPPPPPLEAERRQARYDGVRAWLTLGPEDAARWPVHVTAGPVAQTIAAVARERHASVILLGRGDPSVTHRLFGDTAVEVLRHADCPILVPHATSETPASSFPPRRAVVGVDFSPASVWAAERALEFLADGATLTLVHVHPPLDAALSEWLHWDAEQTARLTDHFARLRAHLARCAAERPGAARGVDVQTAVVVGTSPAGELIAFAEQRAADLLVVGGSGPRFVERLLVGGVARGVLRRGEITILALPRPPVVEADRIERLLAGAVEHTDRTTWADALAAFTWRNAGRPTALEVEDPAVGAYVQERGYALLGATYDRHDGRVELMLGDPADATRHLTRTIPGVSAIAITCDGTDHPERDAALRIRHGRGRTVLRFLDTRLLDTRRDIEH